MERLERQQQLNAVKRRRTKCQDGRQSPSHPDPSASDSHVDGAPIPSSFPPRHSLQIESGSPGMQEYGNSCNGSGVGSPVVAQPFLTSRGMELTHQIGEAPNTYVAFGQAFNSAGQNFDIHFSPSLSTIVAPANHAVYHHSSLDAQILPIQAFNQMPSLGPFVDFYPFATQTTYT